MIKTNTKAYNKHPLSQSWQNSQKMTSSSRVSFFGKGITCIDRLDNIPYDVLNSIKQLDLSHNAISKLENVKQFPNLQVLNLAHNHIIDGKQVSKLSKINKLKVLMVKGNPFLKSGENLIQAYKVMLPLQTDISILSEQLQNIIQNLLAKYIWRCIKKEYLSHLSVLIQMVTEYGFQSNTTNNNIIYNRIMDQIADQRVESLVDDCRKEVITYVMKGNVRMGKAEGEEQGLGDSIQDIEDKLGSGIAAYEEVLDKNIADIDAKIANQEEIYNHVKVMRREKGSKQKQTPLTVLKRMSKPILPKKQTQKTLPKLNFRRSPQKSQPPLTPSQNQHEQSALRPVHLNPRHLQQKFQSFYSTMLTKHNPVYQLLYSPLHSLKSKEKDLLIQTLSLHLKERSFAAYKAEKYKEEFSQLNRKYAETDAEKRECEKKIVETRMQMGEAIGELQMQIQDKDQFLTNLNTRIQQMGAEKVLMLKRIQYLEEELSQAKLKIIKQNNIIQKHKTDQQYQDIIQARRHDHIKKQYLQKLCQKAALYFQFHKNQQTHRQLQNFQLLQQHFNILKRQRELTKNIKKVQKTLQMNRFQQFVEHCKYQKSIKKLGKFLKNGYQQSFMKIIMRNYCIRKDVKARVGKFQIWKRKMQMNGYFRDWKTEAENKRYIHNLEKANVLYKELIKKRSFKNWIIYQKTPIYLQAELSVDLKTLRIRQFLHLLTKNSLENSLIHQKFLNLIVFKNKVTRIKNFSHLKQNCTVLAERRAQKINKLQFNLKIHYFYQFARLGNQAKYLRQYAKGKDRELAILRKRQVFNRFSSDDNMRRVRLTRFKKIAVIYRKVSIGMSLKDSLKEFMIEDKRNKNDIRSFIQFLQLNYLHKLKLTNKTEKLKVYTNTKTITVLQNQARKREFLIALMKPLQEKRKLAQFLNKKFFRLMLKYFNQWKVESLKQKVTFLKNRIHQFGPQIEEISKRQKSVFQQKLVLMNIIDNKQKTIKGFVKQLQQAEYTIKTKQEKYQKLKQFLHDAGEDITVIGSKIQPSILAPQRDFDTFLDEERADYFNSFRKF